jgi:hypothetical protein
LRDDALANQIIYEHEGRIEPVRIMLRPLLAMRDQLSYVHYVCLRVTEALKRFPALYLEDPAHQTDSRHHAGRRRMAALLMDAQSPAAQPHLRPSRRGLRFRRRRLAGFPPLHGANLTGVGGIHFAPVAEELVMRDVVPALVAHDPGLAIELLQDQRSLFIQVLIDHANAVGRPNCNICFVEPKYVHEGPDEQSVLSRLLGSRHGLEVAHADPASFMSKATKRSTKICASTSPIAITSCANS